MSAILEQKIAPGLSDRLAARLIWERQLTDEPLPPDYRDNLYEPVPGDHGACGRFTAIARPRSPPLWATTNRPALTAGFAAAALLALALRPRRPSKHVRGFPEVRRRPFG